MKPLAIHAIVAIGAAASLGAQDIGNFGLGAAAGTREVLVGQPLNNYAPGLVYVYRPDARGAWREVARLTAPVPVGGDRFGHSLALDGNQLLVGATAADSGRGAVFVLERSRAGVWRHVARLTAAAGVVREEFGRAVALRGDVAAVASWGADSSGGAVYVFRRGRAGWTQIGRLVPSSPARTRSVAAALSVSSDWIAWGLDIADSGRGAVQLFQRDSASQQWRAGPLLSGPQPGDGAVPRFGRAVALEGDDLFVAAPGSDRFSGAVWLYRRDSTSGRWTSLQRLLAFDGTPGTAFGLALAVVGPEVWVGAGSAVYQVRRDGAEWIASRKLDLGDVPDDEPWGGALAVGGDAGVVGLPRVEYEEGAALIYTQRPGGDWTLRTRVVGEVVRPEAVLGNTVDCRGGKAGIFGCKEVDLLSLLPVSAMGGARGVQLSGLWGWTDSETGREYALVGRMDGTSFVDVTDPVRPVYLGDLPKTAATRATAWREIKVYRNHAFVVSDGAGAHGMQVFDLTRLRRAAAAPVTFTEDAHYGGVASAHNIVIDTATGYAFIVGANGGGETCGGGLHMVDVRDARRPAFVGCFADTATGMQRTGYTHDAQCVVYHGPDARYRGRQICVGSNETAISIADVTDKTRPVAVARAAYPNVGYTHQGWFTEDQRYFLVDDEGDEIAGMVSGTRTLVWDLSDLEDPVLATEYIAQNRATDHNLYIRGRFAYQSNYVSGLRILDITNPRRPVEYGFFDTVPVGADEPGYDGTWSNYPFLRSGTILVSSMKEGLFLLRRRDSPSVP